MSTFKVTLETIGEVNPAENSDRLDLVRLESKDYDFITQKGLYKSGDKVVYFPVDSLLPMWIVDALGLIGKLAYGNIPTDDSERLRNRVKTVKLRGNLSQGVVCTPDILIRANSQLNQSDFEADNLAPVLDVEKYEPPVISGKHGNLVVLPDMVSVYDIESAQNYTDIANMLMDTGVYITEKIEGSNWWCSIDNFGNISVGQRNYAIDEVESGEHDWWKVSRQYNIEKILPEMWKFIREKLGGHLSNRLTLRGEIIGSGVQGNYYNLNSHDVLLFDIEFDGKPIDAYYFNKLATDFGFSVVPELCFGNTLREWLGDKTIKQASNGRSELIDRKREGIVIKPMNETYVNGFGRLFLKQRSPEYLEKSDN